MSIEEDRETLKRLENAYRDVEGRIPYSVGMDIITLRKRVEAHDSDCATHNGPALPQGICDCKTHTVVRFGEGWVMVETGLYDGQPAIFLEPAAIGGRVGENTAKKEGFSDPHTVKQGSIVFTTKTIEAAHDLFAAITGKRTFRPTHKHVKSGGLYMLLPGTVKIEATWEDGYEYVNKAGERIVRPVKEFNDGRFQKLTGPCK